MVEEAAVLVVGEEERRPRPLRAREEGGDHLGDELLPDLDVGRGVLVVLGDLGVEKDRVNPGDLRESPGLGVRFELRDGYHLARVLVADVCELDGEGELGGVDLPRHARRVEALEDRPARRDEVGRCRRQIVPDVTEGRGGEEIEAVRERLGQRRAEEAVRGRELPVEPVVEGQIMLVVVAHRAAAAGIVGEKLVGRSEAVHRATVPFPVRPVPGMIEVGDLAVAVLMERPNGGTAGSNYAGEKSQNTRNTASVSQYDQACAKQPH